MVIWKKNILQGNPKLQRDSMLVHGLGGLSEELCPRSFLLSIEYRVRLIENKALEKVNVL
jgi:hypothetical protein